MNNIFNIIEETNKDKLLEIDKNFLINECGMESVVVNKMNKDDIINEAKIMRSSDKLLKKYHKLYEGLA